ncbi:hypothetical protein PIB30_060554 [Stylosanthes scabra]|uniref:Uncharacterized protein n=1 Tax=Stylosanthes scabra TaxID=79078 RepID=A0ABU6TMQ9_9FABA|nr:hypothetical protein [Stylosanthes scabra]
MVAILGALTPHPQYIPIGVTPYLVSMCDIMSYRVASPSFGVNLLRDNDDDGCDLGDSHSFGELTVTMVGTLQPRKSDSLVEEALCDNDSDKEPTMIDNYSDDDWGSIPVARQGPSSSGIHRLTFPP